MFIKSKNVYVELSFVTKTINYYDDKGYDNEYLIEINDVFVIYFRFEKKMEVAFNRIIKAHQTGAKFVDISDFEK